MHELAAHCKNVIRRTDPESPLTNMATKQSNNGCGEASAANDCFAARPCPIADVLRASMHAGEYTHVVLWFRSWLATRFHRPTP